MALFQFNNQTLPYEINFAPFAYDLVLLQSSRFTPEFWRSVLDDLVKGSVSSGGRILTCDWKLAEVSEDEQVEHFFRLLQTLGMHGCHAVAFDDAVKLIGSVERLHPGVFEQTLLFPQGGPKAEPLEKAVRDFCGI